MAAIPKKTPCLCIFPIGSTVALTDGREELITTKNFMRLCYCMADISSVGIFWPYDSSKDSAPAMTQRALGKGYVLVLTPELLEHLTVCFDSTEVAVSNYLASGALITSWERERANEVWSALYEEAPTEERLLKLAVKLANIGG